MKVTLIFSSIVDFQKVQKWAADRPHGIEIDEDDISVTMRAEIKVQLDNDIPGMKYASEYIAEFEAHRATRGF